MTLQTLREQQSSRPDDIELRADLIFELLRHDRATQNDALFEEAHQRAYESQNPATQSSSRFLIARANIAQKKHHFKEALGDLDQALNLDPTNVQGLLTRTTVLRLLGRLDEAARSILTLHQHADALIALTAAADLASIRGQADNAWHLLETKVLPSIAQAEAGVRLWIETTAAEVAWRSARRAEAEVHFSRALAINPNDLYSIIGYADFLLEEERYKEAFTITQRFNDNQDVRLRQLLAAIALGDDPKEIFRLRSLMEEQFKIDRTFEEGRHYRTEARYALEVALSPLEAFTLSQKNWEEQKEPADALLLISASVAAGKANFTKEFRTKLTKMGYAVAAQE